MQYMYVNCKRGYALCMKPNTEQFYERLKCFNMSLKNIHNLGVVSFFARTIIHNRVYELGFHGSQDFSSIVNFSFVLIVGLAIASFACCFDSLSEYLHSKRVITLMSESQITFK